MDMYGTCTFNREKLTAEMQRMDRALDRSYERFRRGESTAAEMDRERDDLVAAFNQQVMNENIRYRSMLRGRPHAARPSRRALGAGGSRR